MVYDDPFDPHWQPIGRALRAMNQPMEAPPDFVAGVMKRIQPQTQRRTFWQRLDKNSKKAVSVAAALAAVTGSVWGLTLQEAAPPMVAHVEPNTLSAASPVAADPKATAEPGTPAATTPQTPAPLVTGGALEAKAPVPALSPVGKPLEPVLATSPPTSAPTGERALAQTESTVPERVLVSKQRTLTRTSIKLQVPSRVTAEQALRALAQRVGSSSPTSVPLDAGTAQVTLFQLTVDTTKADLLNELIATVGTIIDRQQEVTSLTDDYNAALAQRRELQAQRDSTADTAGRQALTAQITSLEAQLAQWDQDASKQRWTIWIEEKGTP
ncbi:hypothetical protein [Heliophilum fasciatum]|uniref:Uncharacterized protein n=1 Tax=Heliophilum fasciatum TaxID=35700 RepID=A0A4R2RPU2_9FIRM|nr:hypothetical protein [Heliophilum fasciatum]MCW2277456.1 hypothetical protein [Heliophilum fasciatum]TCP65253.1 hypothetical protein EDD73_106137 [Heliophilum fasciatum]